MIPVMSCLESNHSANNPKAQPVPIPLDHFRKIRWRTTDKR